MPKGFNLQVIFNELLAGSTQTILFASQREYESLRSSLGRKWREYLGLLDKLGAPNSFEGKFLKCSWKSDECAGIFRLAEEQERVNTPGKTYNVVEL